MKHKITEQQQGITIEISEAEGKQDKLLEAFQECQEGRCSCPTQEYSKLASLQIEQAEGKINLQLKSKPGEAFDVAEIDKCLEYTKNKVASEE